MSIEIVSSVPTPVLIRLEAWLNSNLRSALRPDVSNYTKGRLRCWLGVEPTLTTPTRLLPGVECDQKILDRFAELLGWSFDYCLVTYSGDGDQGIGIGPHRDAGFADYEAWGLNVTGQAEFSYWEGRESFGGTPTIRQFDPQRDAPTSLIVLEPGVVTRFNCKNQHAAAPAPRRWALQFWRAKPSK